MASENENHWLVDRLRSHVTEVDADFTVEPETIVPLPDRTIISAWVHKRCQTIVRVGDEVLHESEPKLVAVCKITLNTGKGALQPIEVSHTHNEAVPVVTELMETLRAKESELLREESA